MRAELAAGGVPKMNTTGLNKRVYLGDGVYAGNDGYYIWLWISDGISESRPIALEPQVLAALKKYEETLRARKESSK
jgi:hypothetical protein